MAISSIRLRAGRRTDEIVTSHLANGPLDWPRLVASIPALEADRARGRDIEPQGQVIVLAEAGASAAIGAAVMRSQGLDDESIRAALTVPVPDAIGARRTLYDPGEVSRAILQNATPPIDRDAIVAEFIVSAGRHPAAADALLHSTPVSDRVVELSERRIRQQRGHSGVSSRRGLATIDDWVAPSGHAPQPPVRSLRLLSRPVNRAWPGCGTDLQ